MTEQQIKYDQMVFNIWLAEEHANTTAQQLRRLLGMPKTGFSRSQMRIVKEQHRKYILEKQVQL